MKPEHELTIAFIGNPNCGKTTLFNAYTGANLKVANWPGVTVEKVEGEIRDPHDPQKKVRLIDLPGTYSLTSYTMEERVSRRCILKGEVDVVINVVDASALEHSLYLTLQLLELGKPVVLALNMMDVVEKRGMDIDCRRLEQLLGIPVLPVSARRRAGLDVLLHAAVHYSGRIKPDREVYGLGSMPAFDIQATTMRYSPEIESQIEETMRRFLEAYPKGRNVRWHAMKLLQGDDAVEENHPGVLPEGYTEENARDFENEVIREKFQRIEGIIDQVVLQKSRQDRLTDRVDAVLTRHEGVVFVNPAVLGNGLGVDARYRHTAQRTVGKILLSGKVAVQIPVPEIAVTAGAACPLPLCFRRQGGLNTALFAHHAAELRRLIPAYARDGLRRAVCRVSRADVVFPELRRITAVMFGEEDIVLFICHLRLRHPERTLYLNLRLGGVTLAAAVVAHDELAGRDPYEGHLDVGRNLHDAARVTVFRGQSLGRRRIEREVAACDILVLGLCHPLPLCRSLRMSLQIFGIVGDLALPVYTRAVGIFVCQLDTAVVLVGGAVADAVIDKLPVAWSIEIYPVVYRAPLVIIQLYTVVSALEYAHQLARRGVVLVGLHDIYVGLGALTVYVGVQIEITLREVEASRLGAAARSVRNLDAARKIWFRAVRVMACDTMAVEDRLHLQIEREWTYAALGCL